MRNNYTPIAFHSQLAIVVIYRQNNTNMGYVHEDKVKNLKGATDGPQETNACSESKMKRKCNANIEHRKRAVRIDRARCRWKEKVLL